jgi:hypothetical protein
LSAAIVAEAARRLLLPGEVTLPAAALEGALLGFTYVIVLRLAFKQALGELVEQFPERRRLSRLLRLERAY